MANLEWPSELSPFRFTFYLQPHVGGTESPLTRTRKTYGLSAPRWICRMSLKGGWDGFDGHEATGPRLDAFIAEMEGGLNTVDLWDFRRPFPIGLKNYYSRFSGETYTFGGGETFTLGERFFISEDAEPTNRAALAGATQMTFIGFEPGQRVFNRGDYVGGDDRAHIVLRDVAADSNGEAIVQFKPPLASPIAAGAAKTMQPTARFQLVGEDAGQNDSEVGSAVVYDLEFIEDLT